jgi:hypothetical protein
VWEKPQETTLTPSVLTYRKTFPLPDAFEYPSTLTESSPIIRRAKKDLAEALSQADAMHPVADLEKRVLHVLHGIATRASVYPSIAADDNGSVVLHWVAGHIAIEIEIGPGDSYYFAVINSSRVVASGEGRGDLPAEPLRNELARLTRYAEIKSPDWRKYFD